MGTVRRAHKDLLGCLVDLRVRLVLELPDLRVLELPDLQAQRDLREHKGSQVQLALLVQRDP